MERVVVNESSLAAILVAIRELEEYPEEFRLQKDVNFIVTFKNYMKFIDKELNVGNYLSLPVNVLKKQIRNYQTNSQSERELSFVKRAFFFDMALAVCKELYFAEKVDRPVSNITHNMDDTIVYTDSDIENLYSENFVKLKDAELKLRNRISKKGYPLPRLISSANELSFKYAILLEDSAISGNTNWSYNK